ncbi:hypothetical protein [Polaribacter atrinae]|uniref:hypothetical protein n=1 Tax=Polaribacter atrinae TaxID=1333662 RepID=UPI0030F8FE7E
MIQRLLEEILGDISANIKESFSSYEIEFKHPDLNILSQKLNETNYTSLNNLINKFHYKWDLVIDEFSYSINQEEFSALEIEEYDNVENISVNFNIYKSSSLIVIINNNAFNEYLQSTTLHRLLEVINTLASNFKIENEQDEFEINIKKNENIDISNQCNFKNHILFPYSPDTFYFDNIDDKTKSILDDYFLKLSQVFCFTYLFSSSEIDGDDLHLSITGNLTFKYTLNFKKICVSSLQYYYQIYRWVYSENNKIEDKISISRNIITSYITKDSIKIDNSVFNSILSSNQIYIKGNISKYFEVRNKIIEQIEQTVSNVNKSIDSFVTNFQKSSFVFISFFLSVFIFKVVNKSALVEIFTKETSLIGIGFIIISFLYLIASRIIISMESNRIEKRYNNLKKRYEDVLIKQDIEKILNKDFEYKSEKTHLKDRIFIYTIVWVLSLITFTVALFLASEYLEI